MEYDILIKGLRNCNFEELCEDSVEEQVIENLDYDIYEDSEYGLGATKITIFPKESEIVVKIPLTHDSYNYNYSEEGIKPFIGAGEPDGWNYCKAENILYERAVKADIEYAFLETKLIGRARGNHPIYIQKKAEMLCERKDSYPKEPEKTQKMRTYCKDNYGRYFDAFWLLDFVESYSKDALQSLFTFLDNNAITDLHEGNLGYVDNLPVIVDYAGYYETDEGEE